MKPTPTTLSILQNDSWAAPTFGSFIYALSITLIVLIVNQFLDDSRKLNELAFFGLTGLTVLIASLTAVFRLRYVRAVFENGVEVKAQVLAESQFRSNLRLRVRFSYLNQMSEKQLEQVITGKTKALIGQKTVWLVIDRENPGQILLRDAYL